MKAVLQISVFEVMGKLLNSREAVSILFKPIINNPCKIVELDFTQVEFMSRSFADQFHKDQAEVQKKLGVSIQIINANEEIIRMLQAVSNTQHKTDREFINFPVYKFSSPGLLSDYLLSV